MSLEEIAAAVGRPAAELEELHRIVAAEWRAMLRPYLMPTPCDCWACRADERRVERARDRLLS